MGRWVNRDPIGEKGGVNLHGFVANAPVQLTDAVGLKSCARKSKFLVNWTFSTSIDPIHRIKDNGIIAGDTGKAKVNLVARCKPCCLTPESSRNRYELEFCFMDVTVNTKIWQNATDGTGYSRESIEATMAFEGIWQAYFEEWQKKTMPKVREALNVPCNAQWKQPNYSSIEPSCAAYKKCIKDRVDEDLALLWVDMQEIDRIERVKGKKAYEPVERWKTRRRQRKPYEYLPKEFVPYAITEYDWNGLNFDECAGLKSE